MKATRLTAKTLATFLVVIGVAMIVCAAGIVVSNKLHIPTHVDEGAILTQASVDTITYDGVEHLDLAPTVSRNITYDTGIRVQSASAIGSAYLNFTITKAGINTSDVSLKYWDGNWVPVQLNDKGNYLTGNYGPITVTASYDTIIPFLIKFAVAGDFDTAVQLVTA